mmetsp:Transcript_5409/g.9055  ORF Transcript_5409/g.9055 Transcript_5409/m.9055 type:complete len:115 (-) Transcript_5409:3210-3554(-)
MQAKAAAKIMEKPYAHWERCGKNSTAVACSSPTRRLPTTTCLSDGAGVLGMVEITDSQAAERPIAMPTAANTAIQLRVIPSHQQRTWKDGGGGSTHITTTLEKIAMGSGAELQP